VSAHKTDKNVSHNELYHYHQPVLVSPNIEYIMLVSYGIHLTVVDGEGNTAAVRFTVAN
jgi:hypothetical protein